MAAYWEIGAYSAYDMFSKYKHLTVNLVFPPRLLEWNFSLIVPFPDHCILVPFDVHVSDQTVPETYMKEA